MKKRKWPEDWQEVSPGCVVFAPANAREYKTGSWKAQHPVWDDSKCALNADFATSSVLKGAFRRRRAAFSEGTWITARAVGFVPTSAGPAP